MGTKIIFFTTGSSSYTSGSNTLALSSGTGTGLYPTSGSGITAGRTGSTANDALGATLSDNTYRPFAGDGIAVTSGQDKYIRIDRPAGETGAINIKLRTGMRTGLYATTGIQILDTVTSSILYSQPIGNVITDGDLVPAQINTNGSKNTIGVSDAGYDTSTTGETFYIRLKQTGSFAMRLSSIEYSVADEVTGSNTPTYLQFVSGTYPTSIVEGTIITPPIQVEVLNEIYDRITVLNTGSVTLGVNIGTPGAAIVSGTTTKTIVSGVATFDDIIMTSSGSTPLGTPTITSFNPIIGRPNTTIIITGTNFMV